jgi:hypothetical protein
MEQPIEKPEECRTIGEYILYKLDRTLAVIGVIVIAITAMFLIARQEAMQIATAAVGGLIGYIGGRAGK